VITSSSEAPLVRYMWRRDPKHGSTFQAASSCIASRKPSGGRVVSRSSPSYSTANLVPGMPHSSLVRLTCGSVLPDASLLLSRALPSQSQAHLIANTSRISQHVCPSKTLIEIDLSLGFSLLSFPLVAPARLNSGSWVSSLDMKMISRQWSQEILTFRSQIRVFDAV
jgi:hypothetical protein